MSATPSSRRLFSSSASGLGSGGFSGRFDQIDPVTRLAGSDAGAGQAFAVEPLATRQQIEFPRGYARVKVTAASVTLTG